MQFMSLLRVIHSMLSSYRIFIFLFSILFSSAICQQQNLVFEEIYFEDHSSFGIVEDFYQDAHGFIWIGAKDGLFRYDGIQFKAYYFDQEDPNSISNSVVRKIFGDTYGNIWVTTENGLNRYIEDKDHFIRYLYNAEDSTSISSNFVKEIAEDKDGNLWMATINGGLCRYKKEEGCFERYTENSTENKKLSSDNLRTLFIDSEGIIWIGTMDKGVNYFLPEEGKIHRFQAGLKNGKDLYGNDVRSIVEDKDGRIWFGTDGNGISVYDKKTEKFTYFSSNPKNKNSLGSNIIWSFTIDSKQNLWICTDNGGLNLYMPETNSFRQYRHSKKELNSISSDVVRVLYEDNAGNFWIGNFMAPINYVNNHRKKFYNLQHSIYSVNSLNNNQVTSVLVDSDNILWIGTDGGGLNKYDPAKKSFRHFVHDSNNSSSIPNNKPLCLVEDEKGNIWMGFYEGGLGCLEKKSGRFTHFFPNGTKSAPRGAQIWDMMLDGDDLWLATDKGVDILNLGTGIFTYIPVGTENNFGTNTSSIWVIAKDSKNRILIGTVNGLNVFDKASGKFTYHEADVTDAKSISDRWVYTIFEDSKNRIWVGTNGGGLNLWNESDDVFECYDIKDGLPGNIINGILEDSDGILWISTNNGLSKFNYDSLEITNYNSHDGLQGNRFNRNAVYRDKDGILYFGGINGLTWFDPTEIDNNSFIPPIVFTRFDIFNREVNIHDPESPIQSNINLLNEIHLDYRHHVFTIHFAALNFTQSNKNRYKYMLENFEDSWNDVGNQNNATYTNLTPGRYTFRVMASNNDNIWNTRGRSIDIIVHPPIYRTWWFIGLIILSIIALILAIYKYRLRNIRLINLRLTEMVRERTNELEAHSAEIEEQNRQIAEQRDLAEAQRDKIQKQNKELEFHRNHLSKLVKEQTYELKIAKEKAEEGDKLKTAFLENISHEIRTPLNAILGFINLLIEKKDDQKSRDYYLRIINESGKGMLRLVEDIIDFSRIQIGELKPEYERCNVTELIKELVSANREKIARERPNLNFLTELPKEKVIAITDEKKLKQILTKLLENSIKFTEKGHIRIGIHKLNDTWITFMVEDTGIGIDEELTDKIFDRFFKVQEENTKKIYRGSGLGLAFAKVVTELLGGKMWVESQLNKGSRFYFAIPYIKPDDSALQDDQAIGKDYRWSGKRILVAEDQDSNYLLIEAFFKNTGVELTRADDGVELLEIFEKEPDFDLILLDLKMPRMDGTNAMKIIRESNKTVPVIAQTAYDRTFHREKCLELGCNEYFVKPLKKTKVLETVRKYLG